MCTKKICQPISITPYNFAQAIGNRPFLMLMARKDEFYTVDEAQQLYKLVDSQTKDLVFYDSGHSLPVGYVTQAVDWFQAQLK